MPIGLENTGFSDALVILGAAGLVIPAFTRARISPIIGFILVGVLAGPSGLGRLVGDHPWLYHFTITDRASIEPFAEFGIILLLFSIGLELSFKRLWSMRTDVFGVGAAEMILTGLLIGVAIKLFGQPWPQAITLGLALALSSTALVLPIAGAASVIGRAAFAMLLFEDLALVPLLFIIAALGPGSAGGAASVIGLIIGGILTIAAIFAGGRVLLPRLFAQAARTKSPELFLAASLLVVIVASLATTAAGLSPIVGALLAGLLIAETDYRSEVEVMTAPFRGLALGVFLITVGMSLDLQMVFQNWWALLAGLIGVVAVKAVVTAGLLKLNGQRNAIAAETGLLMGSPSETTLIVLGAAAQAQLILPATASYWQTVTALGLTLTPLLAWIGRQTAQRIERRGGGTLDVAIPPEGPGAVIIGFGRVGRMVADMLTVHGQAYVAVEADIDTVMAARREGYPIIFGDVARSELVDRLNLGRANALILTMDDPVLTVKLTERVRAWVPNLTIVARARDVDHAAELYRVGVTDAVPETLESSLQLSEAVLTDMGIAVGPVIASIHEKRDELRKEIKRVAGIDRTPRFRRLRDRTPPG
ncbi:MULTISPECIES: cation:proton antiporter [unclassified Sphingomonas]|uniref:cation:proton antiporter domain-containing protein n=1 Tax=unclassified Sphingomonas TaxID=196159 RepID=UPI000BDAB001|nr:MAG: sodium:proton exchanger [Sphingomonas sp. 32-62-10]OYY63924.1 MAG: sodium:proton exchanger [Sphingomonas sp. 28-62-11]